MKTFRFLILITAFEAVLLPQPPAGNSAGGPVEARGRGPRLDPAAIERGKAAYSQNCGFCHGVNARGGSEAPDLVRSLIVLGDENGKEVGAFLKVGDPSNGMPSFARLTQQEIFDLAAFLHDRVATARRRTPGSAAAVLVGDANAGRAYFNGEGKCSTCHSVTGDLKGVGARFDAITLQDHIVDPKLRARGDKRPLKPESVEVTLPSGQVISGALVSVTDFSVTLVDANGDRRTFTRNEDVPKVKLTDPAQPHLDMLTKYTDKSLHDLTAYLVTLK